MFSNIYHEVRHPLNGILGRKEVSVTEFEISEIEDLNEDELRHRFERGDFVSKDDIKLVQRLLKKHENEREFLKSCERASISSALIAQRSSRNANILSGVALVVSITALVLQVYFSSR